MFSFNQKDLMLTEICSMFMIDFYKAVHCRQYPKNKRLVAYMIPRMSRLSKEKKLASFGPQWFEQNYLISHFNRFFFSVPKEVILKEYKRLFDNALSPTAYDLFRIEQLHDLGYLPIQIRILPEGTRVPMKVPMIEITNTHDDFSWVVNVIESIMSCSLWHTMVSANVGYNYRQIVNHYWGVSVDDNIPRHTAIGDFSFRGQESFESSIKSSSAFCLSFTKTATVSVIPFMERFYNCDCSKYLIAKGGVSTEHSTMNSNEAIDGDEITFFKKLFDLYPNDNFNAVTDSKDHWNFVKVIIPQCKKEVLGHNGTLFVRGDSGDPVQVVTQTVFELWKTFGGTINSKGFKVLDWHIRAIYGDSITPQRAEEIYKILISAGFACNNVYLGAGSFSLQCLEEDDMLKPYTRDTYGIAVKTTYMEDENGNPFEVFKNPVTDSGFKKSNKGCCVVTMKDGELVCEDGFTWEEAENYEGNCFVLSFKDSQMHNVETLETIRQRLHEGKF
jgi:nicotinamide phosphoribosyltransferase